MSESILSSLLLKMFVGTVGSAVLGIAGLGMGTLINLLIKNKKIPAFFALFGAIIGFLIGSSLV